MKVGFSKFHTEQHGVIMEIRGKNIERIPGPITSGRDR